MMYIQPLTKKMYLCLYLVPLFVLPRDAAMRTVITQSAWYVLKLPNLLLQSYLILAYFFR
jgi:hypothetical protein